MSQKPNKKSGKKNIRLTASQREEKIAAEQAKRAEAEKKRAHAEKLKKAGVVIVCVILVLALGIPTVALSMLSM